MNMDLHSAEVTRKLLARVLAKLVRHVAMLAKGAICPAFPARQRQYARGNAAAVGDGVMWMACTTAWELDDHQSLLWHLGMAMSPAYSCLYNEGNLWGPSLCASCYPFQGVGAAPA